MDIVKENQELTIGKYKCRIVNVGRTWWCNVNDSRDMNSNLFTQFNITHQQIENVLGYAAYGNFPQCRSAEDLTKVIEFILSKDPANKLFEEDYTGRTIKALVDNPVSTGVKLGEEIKILRVNDTNDYVLDKTSRGDSGMCIGKPLNLKRWKLVEESKSSPVHIEEIQEECKRRFPIGCMYIPVGETDEKYKRILKDSSSFTYHIYDNITIWAHDGGGYLYKNGEYAILVSLPEEKTEEYIPKVGDYVVMEKAGGWGYHPDNDGCIAIVEKVGKRRIDSKNVLCIDGKVINPKIEKSVTFSKIPIKSFGKNPVFRKALSHEIPSQEKPSQQNLSDDHSDKISYIPVPKYVECVVKLECAIPGKIYPVIDDTHCLCENDKQYFWKSGEFKSSTQAAYDAQQSAYNFKVGDWVIGWHWNDHDYINTPWEIGDINASGYIVPKKNRGHNCHPKRLKLVSTKEAYDAQESNSNSNFKVGDWVIYDGDYYKSKDVYQLKKSYGHGFIDQNGSFRDTSEKGYRHATSEEIAKKLVINKEWEPGTYAVGIKGNFGTFTGDSAKISVGRVYSIIRGDGSDTIGVLECEFWAYKVNFKWFATKGEAESFAKTLSKTEPIYASIPDPLPTVTKTKPLIENVQSISVNLRTKKNNNKFKF